MVGLGRLFASVRDPRAGDARYDLSELLFIAFAAMLCGAETCVDMAAFGTAKVALLREVLSLEHGVPSHDTFGRVFGLLDPEPVEGSGSINARIWVTSVERSNGLRSTMNRLRSLGSARFQKPVITNVGSSGRISRACSSRSRPLRPAGAGERRRLGAAAQPLRPRPDGDPRRRGGNAAERALRGIALGRKSWLFAGSDRGARRAATMYSLIVTAKLNDIDPQAWLADVLARIAAHPAHQLDDLLQWNWTAKASAIVAAAA
jgi:hypothetical protein